MVFRYHKVDGFQYDFVDKVHDEGWNQAHKQQYGFAEEQVQLAWS